MNSAVRPNFKVFYMKKVHAGPINSTRDPLKTPKAENFQFSVLSKRALHCAHSFQCYLNVHCTVHIVYNLYLANLYISLVVVSCTLKLLDFLELLFLSKNQGHLLSIITFLYINVNRIYFFPSIM